MKKRIFQVICLVLTLILCVSLFAACGSSGNKTTTPRAEVTNSTAVMIMSTLGNENAIGYVS